MKRHAVRQAPQKTGNGRAPEALAVRPDEPGILGVFQRLASDPKLTVEKLGELIKLQERILDREAAAAFEAAYALMLPELPRITKRGVIKNKQGEVQSRYSRYEDLRKVTDPILRRFGFVLHYSTAWPAPGVALITGTLVHSGGGRKESTFQSKADASGGKNEIQGLGSAVSYGKRYVRKDLLQIVEEGEDDDAQQAGQAIRRQETLARRQQTEADLPAAHHPDAGQPITLQQRSRLVALVQNSGRTPEEVVAWLERRYGWTSTKQVTRARYDEICTAVERPGELLPLP